MKNNALYERVQCLILPKLYWKNLKGGWHSAVTYVIYRETLQKKEVCTWWNASKVAMS